jgi:DNA-binding response OmpR family regulator
LLIEDESTTAAMLAKGLREHAFAVDIAPDGKTGIAKASVNSYDLIVLDVMLPGLSGFEICLHLRAPPASRFPS